MWEPEIIKPDVELGNTYTPCNVVMADKMYRRDSHNSFVYDPKKNKWETDEMLNSKKWLWACVIDDVLYYHDLVENSLITYDPKKRCWGMVNGLQNLLAKTRGSELLKTVNYGRKLALFFHKGEVGTVEIWCAEISLERRERGEILGKVECCDQFMLDGDFYLEKSVAVML
ncbi:unnamed protein product [Microthlaspi erraticum]|uniref:FKB95-like N-terminal Kelch domain-containing protein n=1 Tax=Microthlaspi erraticum TaxID=1685480 RepID=A0A6D2JFX5_9BRAS|nr:unnamed protein product [Microthlaspi erraticum]